jgi:hypothetical protein
MVFAVSEFIYDEKMQSIPFVVGPSIMEKYSNHLSTPLGMIFSDTQVAGPYPYVGDRLIVSIVLCRLPRESARSILSLVEKAARTVDPSTSLTTYLTIANLVMDGFEMLLGLNETKPLVGYRKEFHPDYSELKPGYYALINMPESEVDTTKLWVLGKRLVYGKDIDNAKPFRESDYVLYSIGQMPERTDLNLLPFYPVWKRVQQEAMEHLNAHWESAKANLATLIQNIRLSPDLTKHQASQLVSRYRNEATDLRKEAEKQSSLGIPGTKSEFDRIRMESLEVLDL